MERNIGIDVMKVVLAAMVVGIHLHTLEDIDPFLSHLLCNGLFRIAVPIFLIINGYYFFSVVEAGAWRQWFVRVLGLYAVWMLVYLPFWGGLQPSIHSLMRFGHHVAFGYHHLWYLPGMLGAAGLVWIASRWSGRWMLAMCAGLFALCVSMQYAGIANAFDGQMDWALDQVWVYRNAVFLAFPFFGLGYLIAKGRFEERVSVGGAAIASLVGLALLTAESGLAFMLFPERPLDALASLGLLCPAVFLLVKRIGPVGGGKAVALVASGVYFTHVLVIRILEDVAMPDSMIRAATVLLVSMAVAASLIPVNQKLRYVL